MWHSSGLVQIKVTSGQTAPGFCLFRQVPACFLSSCATVTTVHYPTPRSLQHYLSTLQF